MKKFVFSLVLALFACMSNAQHFPPVGAVWKMDYNWINSPGWAPYYPTTTWSVVKDTVIHDRRCRKVVNTPGQDLHQESTRIFFYHESGDSLYEYAAGDSTFHLLLWFGIQVDDTTSFGMIDPHVELGYDVPAYVFAIDTVTAWNDTSISVRRFALRPLTHQRGYHIRYVYDKVFLQSYSDFFNDAGLTSSIPEWEGWVVRCYSDSAHPVVRMNENAKEYSCDYKSVRPLQPPTTQWGSWTYSKGRTSLQSATDFIKVRSIATRINNRLFFRCVPWLNNQDSMPEGMVMLTNDSIGELVMLNDSLYRMYDFSLNVGDTGIGHCGPFCKPWLGLNGQDKVPSTIRPFRYIVTDVYYDNRDSNSLGSVNVTKKMRVKAVPVTPFDSATYAAWQFNGPIYEGIGCLTSLFGEPSSSPAAYDTGYLRCYNTDIDLTFTHRKTLQAKLGCEEVRMSVPEAGDERRLTLHPNPSQGILQIATNENSGVIEIAVTDLTGKCVYRGEEDAAANSTLTINLTGLTNGLYIVSLKQGDSVSHQKVIIQR